MNCPNCGAPMRVAGPGSYLYCRYCSSFHFPKGSQDGVDIIGIESEQHCPLCEGTLVAASIASYPALTCRRCQGVLINQAVFALVVSYLRDHAPEQPGPPRALNQDDLLRQIHCPNCRRQMDTHPYYGPGSIVIDVCMACRLIWLDRGEIGAIMNALRWHRDEND